MYGKFWFGGDFFVPVAFTKEVFFFSWQIGTLSFFFKPVLIFYLFHQRLSFLLNFFKVRNVNKIWK